MIKGNSDYDGNPGCQCSGNYFEWASVNIGGFLSLFDVKLGSWILI